MGNLEQLRKGIGKFYRIQPFLLEFTPTGVDRGFLDDAWELTAVSDESFTLRHRELGRSITLGSDSYVNFNKDPDRDARLQVEGVLVLKSQVYMIGDELGSVYTKEPGRQHRDFRPPASKPTLVDAARAAQAKSDLQRRQQLFLMGGDSLRQALDSFAAIPAALARHVEQLEAQDLDVEVQTRTRKFEQFVVNIAVWCNGWWFTLELDSIGTVEQLQLQIVQWQRIPRWAGFTQHGDEAPKKKVKRQYRLTGNGPRWVGGGVPPHTAEELAEWLLMLALDERGKAPKL